MKKKTSKKLKVIYTSKVNLKKCKNSMLCADVAETNTCLSELGAPVIIKRQLFGIVSHECDNQANAYTLVPEYRSWIESITLFKDL